MRASQLGSLGGAAHSSQNGRWVALQQRRWNRSGTRRDPRSTNTRSLRAPAGFGAAQGWSRDCDVTPDPKEGRRQTGRIWELALQRSKRVRLSALSSSCRLCWQQEGSQEDRITLNTPVWVGHLACSPISTWSHQSGASSYSLNPLQVPSPPLAPEKSPPSASLMWAWVATQFRSRDVEPEYTLMAV